MCTPAHSFGVGMFVAGMKAAASGALIGGIVGGIISALQGNSFMEGLVNGIVDGFINGFTTGALFFCMSEVIQAYTNTVNSCGTPGTKCFKEGTLILTAEGSKPIEDIQVGDEVWAYDEETGEKALKKVVQLFRNTTKQWTQVEIETEEGIETITCTPGHKFYLPENKQKRDIGQQQEHESYYHLSEKWVRAIDLKIKDKVLLENGKYGIIKRVTLQQLETPEVTYNFEVEDYHTYYVGSDGILTHNTHNCGANGKIYDSADDAHAAAKKDLGIKPGEKPKEIIHKYYDDGKGYWVDENVEVYSGNRAIVNHSAGYYFSDGGIMQAHYNVGIWESENRRLISTGFHYFY
ncbi:MAG: Hint domain-containing protein [Prevotella sp.]|nr:Hint domain-containing protein [Prevotella sp.]